MLVHFLSIPDLSNTPGILLQGSIYEQTQIPQDLSVEHILQPQTVRVQKLSALDRPTLRIGPILGVSVGLT